MIEKTHLKHNNLSREDLDSLRNLAYKTIIELETPLGINASGKGGNYDAFFGRDSMITGLKLLRVHKKKPDGVYLRIIDKIIKTASKLQGKEINYLSGEKPGKIIHEYRDKDYYHLTGESNPWYVYPDKTVRNYDSTDATPLFLILAGEYFNLVKDTTFLQNILPTIERAFSWAEKYGHKGGAKLFLEYQLHRPKFIGGLVNQGWMDSKDSILIFGKPPKEPIALVEHQAYYFKALRLWAKIYEKIDKKRSEKYSQRSTRIKGEFNKLFLMKSENLHYPAFAILAQRAQIIEIRSNPGHCLWASVENNGKFESVLENEYIKDIVNRLMLTDLFEPKGGIRTLSTKSKFYESCGYHNGSIWPFDNGLIAEGFENFGFVAEAQIVKSTVLNVIKQFGYPIELYCGDERGSMKEYIKKGGHHGAHKQAWTAATILDFTT